MPTTSYWSDTAAMPKFSPLETDLRVDVAVIGGGVTGVTAAYLMKQAGLTVALLERERCAAIDTAHTSAHLTFVTDLRLKQLISQIGRNHAQAVWDAGQAAIQQIESNVSAEGIDCHFARVPGFLHATLRGDRDERAELREEAKIANNLGFESTYVDSVPIFDRPGVRFPNLARFHPLQYLIGLLRKIPGQGSHVFEQSEAEEFTTDSIQARGHTISCRFVVIATDVPLMGKSNLLNATLFQTKIAPYTSYVIGAQLRPGVAVDALFWDTTDPYFYFRLEPHKQHDYVVFGGADHKTGQTEDTKSRFTELEEVLHEFLPQAQVDHRWSGQVIESVDGLPFIGETAERQFVATGFSGNGITFGTLGAMMARDAALGRTNPWQDLFAINRKPLNALWNYVSENADYPYYMLKDRLAAAEGQSLSCLNPGEGKILRINHERVAAFRDDQGQVTALSPVCTHMGCIVHWNDAEKTWDCPCHGSRFRATGAALVGPAETPLPALRGN